jgi:hypothetical protein
MKLCKATRRGHTKSLNSNVLVIGKGEARHRKYRRLKLGGGQAQELSSD